MVLLHLTVGWPKITFLRSSFLVVCVSVSLTLIFFSWDISRLTERYKCPACYGQSLCPMLQHDPVSLDIDYFGYFGWVMNSITTKNVYRGSLNSVEVIIKRLGHDSELEEMDTIICEKAPDMCQEKAFLPDDMYDVILKDVKNLLSSRLSEREVNRLRFCPSFQNLPSLLKYVSCDNCKEKKWPLSLSRLANIWTMLHINPEPLLLQIFPKDKGWPFPEYLGACGRIIIETYEGTSLIYSYNDPWEKRAWLSLQLLEAVDRFTLHSPDFALYLLDYSVDNIAVNSDSRVSFVDLEHSIIVDKRSPPPELAETWNSFRQSGSFCLSNNECYYSPDDICRHKISDFNHYMMCKEILAPSDDQNIAMPQGLLHSTPHHILQKHPSFESALKNCSSDAILDHMASAQLLRDILQTEVQR